MASVCRLGLTGGIGSGKSTVAHMLSAHGAVVIDADAAARSVTQPGGVAIAPIATAFGSEFIAADGALDRQRMRERVYADADARRRLEGIIHPLVAGLLLLQEEQAVQAGCHCLVLDIPLLVESARWRRHVDRVVVVDCLPQTQIERVMTRSGLSRDDVQGIIDAQASRPRRLKAADIVVFNEGLSMEQLRGEVMAVARHFGL